MKKVISYKLGIMSLVFFLFFSQTGCVAQNKENITAEKKETMDSYLWDFGKVKEGKVLKHDFILKNESKNILNIKDISTSCGCTVSKVKKKRLSPGETTFIEVEFNTKGYLGLTQQFIYVNTDSLDKPILRFIIKAEIVREVG